MGQKVRERRTRRMQVQFDSREVALIDMKECLLFSSVGEKERLSTLPDNRMNDVDTFFGAGLLPLLL